MLYEVITDESLRSVKSIRHPTHKALGISHGFPECRTIVQHDKRRSQHKVWNDFLSIFLIADILPFFSELQAFESL